MKLAVTLALLCATGTAVAAADAGHGRLTKAEYTQLLLMQRRLESTKSFAVDKRICTSMDALSPLLVVEKADCLAGISFLKSDLGAVTPVKRCAKKATQAARVKCLLPIYVTLQQAAAQAYREDRRVDQIAAARHLGAACIGAIGDTPKALSELKRAAAALQLFVTSLRSENIQALNSSAKQTDAALNAFFADSSTASVTVCAHQ